MKAVYDPYYTGHHVDYLLNIIVFAEENSEELYIITSREAVNRINTALASLQLNTRYIKFICIDDEVTNINQTVKSVSDQIALLKKLVIDYKIRRLTFLYLDNATHYALIKSGRFNCRIIVLILNPYGANGYGIYKVKSIIRKQLLNALLILTVKEVYRIAIITSSKEARLLNRLFFTTKFSYIGDPIPVYYSKKQVSVNRCETSAKIRILIPGNISRRKGVIEFLQILISEDLSDLYSVCIAGKVTGEISKALFQIINKMTSSGYDIELYNHYHSHDEFLNRFHNADVVALPYDQTSASSGILALSAFLEKPVLTTSSGLIGESVQRLDLGLTYNGLQDPQLQLDLAKGSIRGKLELLKGQKDSILVDKHYSYFSSFLV